MSAAVAPDYAEAFDAWRTWRVVSDPDGPLLSSLFFDLIWPAGAAVHAQCNRRSWIDRIGRFRQIHAAPGERCECGVYGGRIEQAAAYLWHPRIAPRRAHLHVLGRVRLWGDVVECERGFRASSAYPGELIVPSVPGGRGGEVADGLVRYGVPVRLVECRTREEIVQAARASLRPAA